MISGDGLLRPEPDHRVESQRVRLRALAAQRRRQRATAGVLWLLFGALMTTAAVLVAAGLDLRPLHLAAAGLFVCGLWCGSTAALVVKGK